jgi:uncharacterized membrane protein
MKTRMSCGTAFVYLFMTAVIDFVLTSYIISQIDPNSINHLLYTDLTILFFGLPAFFIGFILFVMMDWGLKRILYKSSALGLFVIAIPLSVPFVWAYFQGAGRHELSMPIAISAALLIGSLFVVGLQYYQEKEEKPKNSL